ncbi:MAG TPA: enoyl-CoA hydratase-related protein [Dehalococcoidia bacterium]|nr:enoyl-CoA hydratase-related protein [Dehalococcoidia bacterium]
MAYNTILHERIGSHIHRITLNRPERLNAMTPELQLEVLDACRAIDADTEARCLIVTGAGRAFCAGADVGNMAARQGDAAGGEPRAQSLEASRQSLRRHGQAMMHAIYRLEIPTIAMVNGVAVGAGFDLVCATDLALASSEARFMIAYMRRALIPDLGGMWLIPRMIGRRLTAEMLYTARFVSAQELLRAGGLNAVHPAEELEAKTLALAEEIAAAAPISNKVAKMSWRVTETLDLEAANEVVASTVLVAGRTEDHRESVRAFMEKRQPVFHGR